MGIKLNLDDIKRVLDRSTGDLDTVTADRLLAARRTALQHQQTKQPSFALAWLSEHGIISHPHAHPQKVLNWGLAMLLTLMLVGGVSYCQSTSERDHSEIDIAILTDDLPVHMYVD